jgi:hypothetical protein
MFKHPKLTFMKKILLHLCATLAALTSQHTAFAHLSYSGRDFGTLVLGNPASTNTSQTISSSFGWADATDSDWGDSHRGRFFRFTLATTQSVMITVQRNSGGNQTSFGGTSGSFLPALSLYSGLGTLSPEALGHDGSQLSIDSRPAGTEGSFRSLSNWSLGNDPNYNTAGDPTSGIRFAARLASFTYIGNAVDGTSSNYGNEAGINGDGIADGYVSATFNDLAAGDYSLFVGGANYAAQLSEGVSSNGTYSYPTYGVDVSVQAVPEPATWILMAFGFGFLFWRILHRRSV